MFQMRYRFYIVVSLEHFLAESSKVGGLPWCFTAFAGVGQWLGQREESTVVEVVLEECDFPSSEVSAVARNLALIYDQEAVFVTRDMVSVELVGKG